MPIMTLLYELSHTQVFDLIFQNIKDDDNVDSRVSSKDVPYQVLTNLETGTTKDAVPNQVQTIVSGDTKPLNLVEYPSSPSL